MLTIAIKGPSIEEAEKQNLEASIHADLLEWRLDYFESLSLESLLPLRNKCTIPTIFTLRPLSQGGVSELSEDMRLNKIEELLELKPAYIDLEHTVPEEFIGHIRARYPDIKIIRTFHDFEKTPDNLEEILHKLMSVKADVYKLACMARSMVDTYAVMALQKKVPSNCLVMTMGPTGYLSRIVAPVHGQGYTYTCLHNSLQVAPGQISAKELVDTYSYRSLSTTTKLFGLIGHPVDKSVSNSSHNALMRHFGLDAVYIKMDVEPHELGQAIRYLQRLGFCGVSVTIPLKEQVMKYCTKVTEEAKRIGAVNTLTFKDGEILGSNTDALGALNALEMHTPVLGKNVVLLGAGGAAKAIAYELIQRGARLHICNRDKVRAEDLAASFGSTASGLDEVGSAYDIIINATSSLLPIDPASIIPGTIAMDIHTRPKETDFLQEAKKRSCHIVYGYEMFIQQAIGQYNTWFPGLDAKKVEKVLADSVLKVVG